MWLLSNKIQGISQLEHCVWVKVAYVSRQPVTGFPVVTHLSRIKRKVCVSTVHSSLAALTAVTKSVQGQYLRSALDGKNWFVWCSQLSSHMTLKRLLVWLITESIVWRGQEQEKYNTRQQTDKTRTTTPVWAEPCNFPVNNLTRAHTHTHAYARIYISIYTHFCWIQTHNRLKRTLSIRTKHSLQIFGANPFVKLQKTNTQMSFCSLTKGIKLRRKFAGCVLF